MPPVCAPSRSCILTGVMPTAMGTQHMRAYGKAKRANPHTGLPFYSAPAPDGVRAFTEYLRQCRVYCTNRSKEDYNFETPPLAWDDSSPTAHWRNRPASAPFFSVFNLFASHESQVWARSGRDSSRRPAAGRRLARGLTPWRRQRGRRGAGQRDRRDCDQDSTIEPTNYSK